MAKKKRKYYSGKELLYRRQLERQQAEAEEKTNNIRVRQLHQINASSRAIGWAKQKMREGKNYVVVREAAWVVKHENRKKYEQEDKEE